MPSNLVRALVATVVGVLLVPLAGVNAPVYAVVGAPVLTSPAPDATVTANPVLSWDRLSGAARYEVQVASSSAFLAPLKFSSSTLNSRATPPADLAVGSWWWRVRAFDSANVAGAYAVSTFSKVAAAAPVVLTPIDLAVLQYPTDPLVYSWQPMAGAMTYEVQVDDDVNFVGALPAVSTKNTRYVPISPPTFNTIFFWHVRGVSAQSVPTEWSEPRSNQMTWANLPPLLVSPPSTKIVHIEDTIEEIVLDWQPVIGASAYQLEISPDDQFNAPIGGTRVVRATTFAPNPTLPAGAYFWRVRALSTSAVPEPGVWSEIWKFTRAWPATSDVTRPRGTDGAGNGLLPQVQLLLPANDDFALSEPNFTWTPQREASNYQFEVGTDVNFSPLTFQTCQTNHTAFTPYSLPPGAPSSPWCSPSLISAGRVLYWRVKALDGTVNGVYSEVRRFMYDPAVALVTQTSPADGSTVDGAPVLRWDLVDNISRYKITVDPSDAACATTTAFTYNTVYVPEALKTTCAGPIAWTVQAVESSGALSRLAIASSWSTFTLGTQPTAGSSVDPVVLTPLDGDPSTPLVMDRFTPPLMQWTPVTSATHYRAFASIANANSYTPMNASTNWPAFAYTGENSTLGKLLDGSYDFYVVAYSSTNAVLATSAVSQFTVTYNIALTSPWPTLMKPDDCKPAVCPTLLYDTPTLDWSPVPGAGYYLVYLSTDDNFTHITRTWSTAYSQLTPLESLPDSQAGQATYWFIRPCFAANACSAFDPSVFGRAHAFRKTSEPITALTPAATTPVTVVTDEVTFTWKDYLATNNALTPVVTQEADNYQVEVSTTDTFTGIIDTSPLVDQTTYTAQTTTYPDGPLFWRVRAFDNTGNPLTYSPGTREFKKESSIPLPTAPAAGSIQSGAPLLTWNPMPFTNTYAVEIYKNPSAPLATANRVASITTRSTAAIATVTLPKGDYGWRVQRIDVNGKAGPWTSIDNIDLRRFTVQGPTPALLTPLNGTKVETTTLLMQWAATAGASRYLAEASTSSTFTTLIDSVTTDMTAWAPGQISPAWPNPTFYWRVSTLDATGQRVATSEVWKTITPPTAPTSVTSIPANAQAVVSWTAPVSDGGSPITGYRVTATPGGRTVTTAGATTATVTGLTNGTAYTFTVTATNAGGTSPPSAPSVAVKPLLDFSGDGRADILAIKTNGYLYFYRGNGAGGFTGSGVLIGTGWSTFAKVLSPGDFTGDGKADILAIKTDGYLYLNRGNGQGGFTGAGVKIGSGWSTFAKVF